MSNPHTPGPWVLEIDNDEFEESSSISIRMGSAIETPGCYKPQHCFHFDGCLDDLDDDNTKEGHANLHLMAKAPELLNAIHEAIAWLESDDDCRNLALNVLRNSIK